MMKIHCVLVKNTSDERVGYANVAEDYFVQKGDTKIFGAYVTDSLNEVADITGSTVNLRVHPYSAERYADKFLEPAVLDIDADDVDLELGEISFLITSASTQGLTVGRYRYKITLNDGSSDYVIAVGDIHLLGL